MGVLRIKVNGQWVDAATGIPGPQGVQGDPGPQGDTGLQGAAGAQGPQGVQGPKGDTGTQGTPGATGSQGPKGDPGATGATGPTGPQGSQGPAGADGTGVSIEGSVPTSANLPTNLGPSDAGTGYITSDTGHLWVWSGTAWSDAGNITGPTGATGPQGPQGPKGDPGATGAQGPQGNTGLTGAQGTPGATGSQGPAGTTGSQGVQGPKGDKGDQGIQGIQGPIGTTGATGSTGTTGPTGAAGSKWYSGTGAPAAGTGITGDWYLNDANGDIYEKTAVSTWTLRDNLTGPQGTTGTAGAPGALWYYGTTAPATGTGIVNDNYLNTTNGDVYLKTAASTWTLKGNIKGPAGTNGTAGAIWYYGTTAPAAGTGAVNDNFLNTATGDVYLKTGASTWTQQGNIKGPQGATGTAGSTGAQGPPGSQWISVSGVPAAGIGTNGDWAINTATSDIYIKNSGTWFLQGNIKGATGSQGTAGATGPTGAQGVPGGTVLTGAWGTQGDASVSGVVVWSATGAVLTFNRTDLNTVDHTAQFAGLAIGDTAIFVAGSNSDVMSGVLSTKPTQAGNVWTVNLTSIIGWKNYGFGTYVSATFMRLPAGPQGPTGATGTAGTTGSQGPKGDPGTAGSTGAQGPAGTPGSIWYYGVGIPTANHAVNDNYLDTLTGDVYLQTTATQWTPQGNIRGPKGDQGDKGAPGTPGAIWYYGTVAPAGGTGQLNDNYLNTTTGDVYLKTGISAWTNKGNIKGPQGPQGVQGDPGPTGATGTQGPTGPTGSTGPAGPGLAAGGTTGQTLYKTSAADYATAWKTLAAADVGAIPATANQWAQMPAGVDLRGVTPKGFPYPVSTDAVQAGPAVIQALATAIDPGVTMWFSGDKNATDAYSTYPDGISCWYLTPAQATAGGWPQGMTTIVTTWRVPGSSSTTQMVTYAAGTAGAITSGYIRSGNSSGWTAWQQFSGNGANVALLAAPVPSASFAAAYPLGLSIFSLSAAQSTSDGGWPTPGSASAVLTFNSSASQSAQFWVRQSTGAPDVQFRTLLTSSASAWVPLLAPSNFSTTRLSSADNLNSVPAPGWYDWTNGSMPANGPEPAASSGFLMHRLANTFFIQDVYAPTTSGVHHWTRQNTGSWSAWVLDSSNIYGRWTANAGSSDLPASVFDEKVMLTTAFQVGGITLSSNRVVIPFTGKYLIALQGSVQAVSGGGIRQMCLGINGATDTSIYQVINGVAASYAWYANGSGIIALNKSDTVSMFLYQSGGATASSGTASISVMYVGA